MPYDYTTTIPELDELDTLGNDDELIIVDKDDLSASPDGTHKRIKPRTYVEQAEVRPSTNLTVSKKLSVWIGELIDSVETIAQAVVDATTTQKGISRRASDAETVSKSRDDVTVSPKNLDALKATETSTGLVGLLAASEILANMGDDRKALTASTLFEGVFGDSSIGSGDSHVFKLPIKDITGATVTQLTIQYGTREVNSVPTDNRPESNFNHNHPFVDIGVTFPEPFESKCLMVVPMGYNVNDVYEEGTEFTYREMTSTITDAVIRASRIEGINNTGERIGVKYIAIGF